MTELTIRKAVPEDMDDISSISRTTWDGGDYLEETASEWIEQDSLFIGVLGGRGIGTFRVSSMPKRVLWLEGLRVHDDYRGMGYGRQLAAAALEKGREIIGNGEFDCMEFSTYFNNHESIHISRSQGFRMVNEFMIMQNENPMDSSRINRKDGAWEDFASCPGHISCGWKFARTCREGFRWVMERSTIWSCGDASFLVKDGSAEITPLLGSEENPELFLDGAGTASRRAGVETAVIFVHRSSSRIIECALQMGYSTWEPVAGCNVLIFRYLDES